jgi:nucleoside-diphosphate-sugar epimerase
MQVAIAGAHGQVAIRLGRLLAERGDQVIGLIRNPDHAGDVRSSGMVPEICDLEHASVEEIAMAIRGSAVVVFAAGAGPGSGAARKITMDRDGAIKLLEASAGDSARYVMLSGIGVEHPPDGDDVFSVYLRAKADADAAVISSDREWTVVRPGALTDEPATGRVRVEARPFGGTLPRADLAAVLAAVVHDRRAARRILYVNGGPDPIDAALAAAS